LLGLGLGACGNDEGLAPEQQAGIEGKADTATQISTLTFDAAWNETLSGALVAGGQVSLKYDEARLPNCRASHNGNPGWQITAYVKMVPGGTVAEANFFDYAKTASGAPDYHTWVKQVPTVSIPAGTTELQIWFKNGSGFDHPCTEWDSDFGKNYIFKVGAAPVGGTLTFTKDWQTQKQGLLKAGTTMTVVYAPERMKSIAWGPSQYYSFFASKYHCYGYGCCEQEYKNVLHVRFNGTSAFSAIPLTGPSVQVAIPASAQRIEIYVDADVWTTTWYCGGTPPGQKYKQPTPDHFYDSNFGNNYVVTLD